MQLPSQFKPDRDSPYGAEYIFGKAPSDDILSGRSNKIMRSIYADSLLAFVPRPKLMTAVRRNKFNYAVGRPASGGLRKAALAGHRFAGLKTMLSYVAKNPNEFRILH